MAEGLKGGNLPPYIGAYFNRLDSSTLSLSFIIFCLLVSLTKFGGLPNTEYKILVALLLGLGAAAMITSLVRNNEIFARHYHPFDNLHHELYHQSLQEDMVQLVHKA